MKKCLSILIIAALCLSLVPAFASEEPELVSGAAAPVPSETEKPEPAEETPAPTPEAVAEASAEPVEEIAEPSPEGAGSGTCGVDLTWTLDDAGTLTISGAGEMTDHPWDPKAIVDVIISSGVTSIGGAAFSGCSNLKSVTIQSGVLSIEDGAFWSCKSLTSLTIPEGMTKIGRLAFAYCSSLKSVTISEGVTSIGDGAFSGCSSLKSVTIPSTVTSLGDAVFSGCSNLTGVSIPSAVTSIGNYAFRYCSNLKSVTIPASVTSIGEEVFNNTVVYYTGTEAQWAQIRIGSGNSFSKIHYSHVHSPVETESLAPTCTTPGYTADAYCSVCKAVLSVWKIVPATGIHTYDENDICTQCKCPKPRDIDRNGHWDANDLVFLAKYLIGENTDIDETAADINMDGKIDLIDLVKLMKYLAGR